MWVAKTTRDANEWIYQRLKEGGDVRKQRKYNIRSLSFSVFRGEADRRRYMTLRTYIQNKKKQFKQQAAKRELIFRGCSRCYTEKRFFLYANIVVVFYYSIAKNGPYTDIDTGVQHKL